MDGLAGLFNSRIEDMIRIVRFRWWFRMAWFLAGFVLGGIVGVRW